MICYTKMKDSMRCFFFYPTFPDFVFYKRSKDLWGNDPIMGLLMSVYSVRSHLYHIFGCSQVIVQGHHRKICCCHWRIDSGRTVFLPSNHWILPWYQLPWVHTPFDWCRWPWLRLHHSTEHCGCPRPLCPVFHGPQSGLEATSFNTWLKALPASDPWPLDPNVQNRDMENSKSGSLNFI